MKIHLKTIIASVLFAVGLSANAQITSNGTINAAIGGESAFLDVSSSSSTNNFLKGLGFPQTNLTTFTFVSLVGSFTRFKTGYDGMLVYNIAEGTTPATGSGIGGQSVAPGFYYFYNPTPSPLRSSASGKWMPLGGAGGGSVTLDATPKDSDLSIDGVQEKVVRLSGTADGTTTHIDLGTSVLAANTVGTFRKAIIYNGTTGHIVMESTGSYDSATNKFVTGNGMMNVLLPAATYTVELYYTE